jgi:hypothetical protein
MTKEAKQESLEAIALKYLEERCRVFTSATC